MAGNFPDSSLPVTFNASVVASIQDRTLQRTFRDALYPRLLYRMEAAAELWVANLGTNQTFTRTGLIKPSTRPLRPGIEPSPKSYLIEQWEATAQQWGDSIDTHMPTSYVSLASQYLRNMHQLGLQAGMSVNRAVRDKGYNAYVAGNSVTDAVANIGAAAIRVVNLDGFTRKLYQGRPQLVSSSNPIAITIPSIGYAGFVTAYTPDVAGDEIHAGSLTITPVLGAQVAARAAVLANNRSEIVYSGGGNSIDALDASDQFALRDVRACIAKMRFNNVNPHEDGLYHFHLDPISESQIFSDNEFQRLNQSLPDGVHYKRFAAGILLGAVFYRNTEAPVTNTVDESTDTGHTTGFELTNAAGVTIHRPIVTSQGWIEEKYLDESRYISDAGVQGKIGEFAVTNSGVQVLTERLRLILRAPLDRLQQQTSTSWSFSGDWPVPTDETGAGSAATFKRAVVCCHGE